MRYLRINLSQQSLQLIENEKTLKHYLISSAANGANEQRGSGGTPRGWHKIKLKIGGTAPINTIFDCRRPLSELYSPALRARLAQRRDWILTRILWLSGLEPLKNRYGQVDTLKRYIYIHGTPDEVPMGVIGSKGCIRMRNAEIVELFEQVEVGTQVLIEE